VKTLLCFLFLMTPLGWADPTPAHCEELARKTEQTFRKMDEALKLKSGMLLGEMEAAKGALEGCIGENKAVSTRLAMAWFLTDVGLLASLGFLLFHQRRMKQAVRVLSRLVKAKDPDHAVEYVPSQGLYRMALGLLSLTFALVNFIALLL
jgi:hypothetical protein